MKLWRKRMGNITQAEAAKLLDVSSRQIRRMEQLDCETWAQSYAMRYLYECHETGRKPKFWDGKK